MTKQTPLQSKKWIAYLVAEITWKIVLVVAIVLSTSMWITLAMVAVAAFVEVVYIGKQADLDRYVRLAEIAASSAKQKLDHDAD